MAGVGAERVVGDLGRRGREVTSVVDTPLIVTSLLVMKARELRKILRRLGCAEVSQKGSHLKVACGDCITVVPVHKGEDIKPGTLRTIEKQLERCLGEGWLGR